MINKNGNHNDFFNLQAYRSVMGISKTVLSILDDLKCEGVISDEYYQKQRKFILSSANDRIREFQEIIKEMDIKLRLR